MLKIHNKLWFILGGDRGIKEDKELAYMCQYEETATGSIASNVEKMQATGRRWSNIKEDSKGWEGEIIGLMGGLNLDRIWLVIVRGTVPR